MADPTTVANLRGRWRASAISSPPADGAVLTTWTETDGSSNADAVQNTTADKPTYRSSGAFLPNSKPVVEFSTANTEWMAATLAQNTAVSRFMVVRFKTVNVLQTITSSPLQISLSSTAKIVTAIENVTFLSNGNGPSTLVANTWYALTLTSNGSNSAISYVNGTLETSSSTAHTNSGTGLSFGSKLDLGETLNAYIAEVLDYSAVLSAGDRATVHSYIQDEYGITVSDYVPSGPPPSLMSLSPIRSGL